MAQGEQRIHAAVDCRVYLRSYRSTAAQACSDDAPCCANTAILSEHDASDGDEQEDERRDELSDHSLAAERVIGDEDGACTSVTSEVQRQRAAIADDRSGNTYRNFTVFASSM